VTAVAAEKLELRTKLEELQRDSHRDISKLKSKVMIVYCYHSCAKCMVTNWKCPLGGFYV
jgi:hypothetical protein